MYVHVLYISHVIVILTRSSITMLMHISHTYLVVALFNPLALLPHVSTESHVGWISHSCGWLSRPGHGFGLYNSECVRDSYARFTSRCFMFTYEKHIYVHRLHTPNMPNVTMYLFAVAIFMYINYMFILYNHAGC